MKVSKFYLESFYCVTNRRVVFKFLREIGEIVSGLPDKKKQKFAWFYSCRYCADRAQNLPGPSPDNVLRVFQISSKCGSLSAEL